MSVGVSRVRVSMEGNFRRFLSASGIGEDGRAVLEEEGVLTSAIFGSLREEHFEKLLPKLKVGDHATLLKLWDTGPGAGTSREVSVGYQCSLYQEYLT